MTFWRCTMTLYAEATLSGRLDASSTSPRPSLVAAVLALAWKDLRLEQRTRQTLNVMLVFSLIAVVTFNFALSSDLAAAREVASGLLWVTILLAGTLGLNRSFTVETESRALDAILISPIDRSALYLGKVLSNTVSILIVEAVLVPIFAVFFNKPFLRPPVLLIVALGTVGYVAAGVLVSSMSSQTRASYILIPILLLPLTLPVVLAAAAATAAFIIPQPPPWQEVQFPYVLVITYDLLMLAAGFMTYNYVVEE